MLYFAYAANLNRSHMERLCPGAEPLFPASLEDYTLTFRKWANVEPEEGSIVHGGVWVLEEENLPKLDWYEDWPGLYERRMMKITLAEHVHTGVREQRSEKLACMVYMMRGPFEIPISPPDPEYLETIQQGYRDWGISSKQIDVALKEVSGVWCPETMANVQRCRCEE